MAITLTDNAINHVEKMLTQRGHGLGLRLGTKKSGCTGYSYVVDYADQLNDDDNVFDCHSVKIVVDNQSLEHLQGMEIDYVTTNLINKGFEFRNPNVSDMCGCGESFNITPANNIAPTKNTASE